MRTTILFVLALAACKRAETQPPPPAPPPVATTQGAPGSTNLAPLAGLATRLHSEAAQRPAATVTAEQLFAALTQRGVTLATTKQVLAATAQASYCALGVTPDAIAIAVCEYTSPAEARAGKRLLDTRYARLVPDAVRTINGTTVLTVANGSKRPAVRDRVLKTFASL